MNQYPKKTNRINKTPLLSVVTSSSSPIMRVSAFGDGRWEIPGKYEVHAFMKPTNRHPLALHTYYT